MTFQTGGAVSTYYAAKWSNAGTLYGYLDLQNFTGTRMKLVYGETSGPGSLGGSINGVRTSSTISSSAQINWVKFTMGGGNITGTINVYGR